MAQTDVEDNNNSDGEFKDPSPKIQKLHHDGDLTDLRTDELEKTYEPIAAPRSGLTWENSIDVGAGVIDHSDVESEEFYGKCTDARENMEPCEGDLDLGTNQLDFDEGNDLKEKKKKKKRTKRNRDEHKSAAPSKKERREVLNQLRAESQRLLRATREAAFKATPIVHKPISSILEKIRKRKQELCRIPVMFETDIISDEDTEIIIKGQAFVDGKTLNDSPAHLQTNLYGSYPDELDTPVDQLTRKNRSSKMEFEGEPKSTFRHPLQDTEDLTVDSPTTDSKDDMSDDCPSSPMEEVLAPSELVMKLKIDSAKITEESSSDENVSDNENISPHAHKSADFTSSPIGDPVKNFLDDEAEEEDDSDNDSRFQDDDEEDDEEDIEGLAEMIAPGYEEKPIDNEKRNLLHQEWLEKQDADGTENLLKKLKYGSTQPDVTLLREEEDEGKEDEEGFSDEPAEQIVTRSIIRMNLKKAIEMIPQMFTDKDDVYLSSDEEAEKSAVKQSIFLEADENAFCFSPPNNEGSQDILDRIKKVNVPGAKKKPKTSAFSSMPLMGGNMSISSKSSFLGRLSNPSLPSYRKNGSSAARSYIFERSSDSNVKSTITMSDESFNTVQRESKSVRSASAKYSSNSQTRYSSKSQEIVTENKSGTSLYEVLMRSSIKSSSCVLDSMVGQTSSSVFAAFKLKKEGLKRERN